MQQKWRLARSLVGFVEHSADFPTDEGSHLRPRDTMHPYSVDTLGNRDDVRVGDKPSAIDYVRDLVHRENQALLAVTDHRGDRIRAGTRWPGVAAVVKVVEPE